MTYEKACVTSGLSRHQCAHSRQLAGIGQPRDANGKAEAIVKRDHGAACSFQERIVFGAASLVLVEHAERIHDGAEYPLFSKGESKIQQRYVVAQLKEFSVVKHQTDRNSNRCCGEQNFRAWELYGMKLFDESRGLLELTGRKRRFGERDERLRKRSELSLQG